MSIFNYFTTGLNSSSYKKIKPDLLEINRKALSSFCPFAVILIGFLLLFTSFFNPFPHANILFAISCFCMTLIMIVNAIAAKKHTSVIYPLVAAYMTSFFALGIVMNTLNPSFTNETTFMIMLFIVPMTFTVKPVFSNSIIFISAFAFMISNYYCVDYETFVNTTIRLFAYTFISICVNSLFMNKKLNTQQLEVIKTELSATELAKTNKELIHQLGILKSVSDIYHSMHLINLETMEVIEYSTSSSITEYIEPFSSAVDKMSSAISNLIDYEHLESALAFTDLASISERMTGKKTLYKDILSKYLGWIRATFIVTEIDEHEKPLKVIFATQIIDEDRKREEALLVKSCTDELTGCFNRHAFEDDIEHLRKTGIPENFVLLSMDINGLKNVNDTKGHAAGDELISSAAKIMKACFEPFGKIYRTGGDEFAGLLYIDPLAIPHVLINFNDAQKLWSGELIKALSVSTGYLTCQDYPEKTIDELLVLADQRMYKSKSSFYTKNGIDRRGKQIAYKTITFSYDQIIKANLTSDYLEYIHTSPSSLIQDNIMPLSQWLKLFFEKEHISESDSSKIKTKLELSNLIDFYKKDNTHLSIILSASPDKPYSSIIFEIIPSEDFSSETPVVFIGIKHV